MTTTNTTTKVESKDFWTSEERSSSKSKYGCEIIISNGTVDDVKTKKAPTDAYIIQYIHEDKVHFDLTRGSKVTLFDMYWDKFKGELQSIEYGQGSIKPNLWGYKVPQQKKKRKG